MKFTVIIVLASLMVSCVSFVFALARPKLGASRIQMTTKMSNGMAANIKTMVGLVVTGLVAVSTPAWGAEKFEMRGYFTGITTPNGVKFDILPGKNALTFLTFSCPNDGLSPATAVVQSWGMILSLPQFSEATLDVMNSIATREKTLTCDTTGVNVLQQQIYRNLPSGTFFTVPDSITPSSIPFYNKPDVYKLKNQNKPTQNLFVNFPTKGKFKITKSIDDKKNGAWIVEKYVE